MRFVDLMATQPAFKPGTWALVYCTVDAVERATSFVAKARGQAFGCTSHAGVFTPRGFERGAFALVSDDPADRAHCVIRATTATHARKTAREAAAEISAALGKPPDAL